MPRCPRRALAALTGAVGLLAALAVSTPVAHATTGDLGSSLSPGQTIPNGSYLSNGDYRLTMQSDGNLVLRHGSTPLWASNTYGLGSKARAILVNSGDFTVWDGNGTVKWRSITNGDGTAAKLLPDGEFVIYHGSDAIWSTHTYQGRSELQNSTIYTKALGLVGQYKYVFGAGHGPRPGPTEGASQTMDPSAKGNMDCSGFVRYVYYLASGRDIMNGNTTTQLNTVGSSTDVGAPGSLIFYSDYRPTAANHYKPTPHHVGIYAGDGHLINEWGGSDPTLINGVDQSTGYQLKYYSLPW